MDTIALPTMWSWQEFLDRATAPDTIVNGSGRREDDGWAGASWDDAVELARSGWIQPIPEVDAAVAELRTREADGIPAEVFAPVTDVTGSEVDVATYLAGVPECMLELEPRQLSTHGRVVTFLASACYSSATDHRSIINRGVALAALCTAIVTAGHSVEIWSGHAVVLSRDDGRRHCAVARVLTAGEPLDTGRILFALAHPAMLRRIWFGVWDSSPQHIAARMPPNCYGLPQDCTAADLPAQIAHAYVFPHLGIDRRQWASTDSALAWCRHTFADLGLLAAA